MGYATDLLSLSSPLSLEICLLSSGAAAGPEQAEESSHSSLVGVAVDSIHIYLIYMDICKDV